MQEDKLYEYAVIRVVPRVEREEFFNAGVILYCRPLRFLKMKFTLDRRKLHALCSNTEPHLIEEYLKGFEHISNGEPNSGPIGKLDIASRFRWLTATRSTMVQTSKVHSGLCSDPEQTLDKLFRELVEC